MRTTLSLIVSVMICLSMVAPAQASVPPHPKVLKLLQEGNIELPYHLKDRAGAASRGINALPSKLPPGFKLYRRETAGPAATYRYLAIIVQFTGKPATTPAVYFDSLLYGMTGPSVRDYYQEVSYGTFDVVTVNYPSSAGWITAPGSYSYYVNSQYGLGSYPNNSQKLAEDVIALTDPYVDFSQYDNNGDGYVDALSIIHTGPGAELTGNSNDMWSHAWSTPSPVAVDGVMAWGYSVQPEYWYAAGDMTIGVYVHEMGHSVFGLPDLYDYGYDSRGLGAWSLMAFGSWGGPSGLGESPSHPDAWSRSMMGLATPTNVILDTAGVDIPAVQTSGVIYRLWTNGGNGPEYFLAENRQKSGYDSYLPADGLAIYHIDELQSGNDNQWYPGHTASGNYLVALVQPDNLYELEKNLSDGDSGDVYPGSTGTTTFDSASSPYSRDYAGGNTYVGVRNISPSGPVMTADLEVVNPNKATITRYTLSTFSGSYASISGSSGPSGDDDGMSVALPFPFLYDRHTYDELWICTNGWVEFGSQDRPLSSGISTLNERLFMSALPNKTLAPWWDDLMVAGGAIQYATLGSAPDRAFVVEWQNVLSFFNGGRTINFQVRLYESTGIIEFWYGPASGTASGLEAASFGIEDHVGGIGHFIDGPTGSNSTGTTGLNSEADWPAVFYRFQPAPLELVRPTGGEYFYIGLVDTIRWRSTGVAGVDLEYSTDSGESWDLIDASIPSSPQYYAWLVPDAPTAHARIRISDASDSTVADTSRADFIIQDIPVISVDPDSLAVVLFVGDSTTRTITIGNTGPGELVWNASIVDVSAPGALGVPSLSHGTERFRALLPVEDRKNSSPDAGDGQRYGVSDATQLPSARSGAPVSGASMHPRDAAAGDILLWSSPNNGVWLTTLTSVLQAAGFTVVQTDARPISPESNYRAIFISEPMSTLTGGEITALQSYVSGGGKIIDMTDSYIDYINPLLSVFGVTRTPQGVAGSATYSHSIFDGVGQLTLDGDNWDNALTVNSPSIPIATVGVYTVVSMSEDEKVLVFGEDSHFTDFVNSLSDPDNLQLLANVIDWIKAGELEVSISPDSGAVAPGASQDLTVTFRAGNVLAGQFDYDIVIANNDPLRNPEIVPAHLQVFGAPDIAVSDDTLDFGDAFIGYPDTLLLTIFNDGTDTLKVGSMTSDNVLFSVGGSTAFDVPPSQSQEVGVILTVVTTGPQTGTLTIGNNDPSDSLLAVHLSGTGVQPPVITVEPDSFYVVLNENDSTTRTMTIGNTGQGELVFSIYAGKVDLNAMIPPVTAQAQSTAVSREGAAALYGVPLVDAGTNALPRYDRLMIGPALVQSGDTTLINFDDSTRPCYFAQTTLLTDAYAAYGVTFAGPESTSGGGILNECGNFGVTGHSAPNFLAFNAGSSFSDGGIPTDPEQILFDSPVSMVQIMVGSPYGGSAIMQAFDPFGVPVGADTTGVGSSLVSLSVEAGGISKVVITASSDVFVLDDLMFVGTPWITIAPVNGTVAPGSSQDVEVRFNSKDLRGGDYDGAIVITNNDPVGNPHIVPAHLHVIGMPDIAVSDTALTFGDVYVGYPDTLVLTILNEGSDTLEVGGVVSDNIRFSVSGSTAFDLAPSQSQGVGVILAVAATGPETGTLTISSNDPADSLLSVHLSGNGVQPPFITVDPDSLYAAVNEGDSAVQTITIGNTGPGELRWSASIGSAAQMAVFSLPAARIVQRDIDADGPAAGPAMAAGLNTDAVERWLSPSNALLADLTGKHIGIVNLATYSIVASDLQLRGAIVHEVILPITQVVLDSLDILAIDDGVYSLSGSEISGIRAWVEEGNSLLVQGDDMPSMTNINALLSGTGISETGLPTYYTGWFTGIFPHPTTVGVDTVYGVSYGSYCAVALPAQTIVLDDSGRPHVAVSFLGAGNVIASGNEIAQSGGLSYGDTRLFVNQLFDWLATRAFLALSPDSGTVAPGASQDLSVLFNAGDLTGGDYNAAVIIASNAPVNNPVAVPAHMHVIGVPNIAISDDTLDFGEAFIGYPDSLALTISNTGSDTLKISGMASDNARFGLGGSTAFDLAPSQSQEVGVILTAVTAGPETGTLTISSNDPSDSLLAVHLSGIGLEPPAITVVPDSFSVVLNEGDSTTQTMTIGNSGLGALEFHLVNTSFVSGAGMPAGKAASHGAADLLSTRAPDDYSARRAIEKFSPKNTAAAADVLLLEDVLPWNSPAIDTILNQLGVPYDLVNSSSLASVDLTQYRLIIVASDQTTSFYSTLAGFSAEFSGYVSGGGVLEFHGAGWGWNSGNASLVTLPGGVNIAQLSASSNYVVDSLHPVMAGVPNPFTGTSASHSYFTNLAAGTQVITVVDSPWTPTLIEYDFGGGRVIASGHTLEFGYAQGQHAGTILTNLIPYALSLGGARWLSFDPDSGMVDPGLSQDITVTFNAGNLSGGDYHAGIVVVNNDPARNPVTVPVHLHVVGVPDIAVSDDTLDFGDAWIGYSDTLGLEIVNDGSDSLDIVSITTDNPEFTLLGGTSFSVESHGSYNLPVVFTPGAGGIRSGTLTINSNDPNEPALAVGLTGAGLEPPIMSLESDTLEDVQLFSGDTTSRTITVFNTGGSDLLVTASVINQDVPASMLPRATYEGSPVSAISRTTSIKSVPEYSPEKPSGGWPAPAAGPDSVALPVFLTDALGYMWDIYYSGEIANGSIDAFDGGFKLTGFPPFSSAETGENGREVAVGPADLGSYTVLRKVFAPDNAAFVRYLEILENTSPSPIIIEVPIFTDLGSDGNEVFCQTSSGDASFTTDDRWIVTDDAPDAGDPAVVHVIAGENGGLQPDLVGGGQYLGYLQYRYVVPVAAYGRAAILHFGAQRANGTEGTGVAGALMRLEGEALTGLSSAERAAVVNFDVSRLFSVTPDTATVPPASSAEFRLKYNAVDEAPGSHTVDVLIGSNDPVHPGQFLPASVTVAGAPGIAVSNDTIDFGDAFVGYPDTVIFGISNVGSDTLEVTGLSADNPRFAAVTGTPFGVAPGQTGEVRIRFTPIATGIDAGVLTIQSSDPTDAAKAVALLGTGINPAIVSVEPDSLVFALFAGDSGSIPVDLTNAGQASLNFSINVTYGNSPGVNSGRPGTGSLFLDEFIIPLTATDSGPDSSTIRFGKHPDATYGIDTALGEDELPPVPPLGVRDVRFIDLPGKTPAMGQGLLLDLRPAYGPAPVDSYLVKFQPANSAYPIHFSWPSGLDSVTTSLTLQDPWGGIFVNVDMRESTGVSIASSAINHLYIISEGLSAWLSVSPTAGSLGPGAGMLLDARAVTGSLAPGDYRAWIVIVSDDLPSGRHLIPVRLDVVTDITEYGDGIPTGFMLHQNFPNPFNPGTVIRYEIPGESHITLTVENVLGQEVATLVNERQHAGRYEVTFDGSQLPSGVYFYRIQADGFTETKKLLLMK